MRKYLNSILPVLLHFGTVLMFICALATACTQRPDDSEFIRDMYEKCLYEDYDFLEQHCSRSLLAKLSEAYDYEGDGYAVWEFRSGAQDGPSNEHTVISIEDEGDGWYRYKAIDMGITFTKKIKISHEGGAIMIEDIADDHKLIVPLPSGLDVDDLKDCTVPAAFTSDDFRWMGGNLRMTVYSKDLYDAVEISQMQVGDTLLYTGEPMVIESIEEVHGGLDINGGLENNGCCLAGYEGGTYVARNWDDHATYTELGKAELALADDFVIIDCGEFPTDPVDTIRTGQKLYLESLKDSYRSFFSLNTLVTIENGVITEINRRWIP